VKRVLLYGNWLLVAISILAAVAVILYVILLVAFGQGHSRVIYWLAFPSNADNFDILVTFMIVIFFVASGIFLIVTFISHLTHRVTEKDLYSGRGAKAILLLMLVGVFFCIGSEIIGTSQLGEGGKTVDSVSLDNHIYHLLLYSYDWARGDGYYYVYECDRIDFFCDKVSNSVVAGSTDGTDQAHLVIDPITTTISTEINNKIVFVYQPK